MIRALMFIAVASALTGCMRFQNRLPKKDLPPPYGSVAPTAPKPANGASPLDLPSAGITPPPPPDERSLIPPKPNTPVTPAPTPNVAADPGAKNLADLKALAATANTAWSKVSTYEMQLTRREINPKGAQNSEVLIFQYRRDPMSVYTKNLSGNGKGRETVYNPSAFEDKLHVKLGEGDSKLLRAGSVAPAISPDDTRVKEKARYSIREAGFGRWIVSLNKAVAGLEAGRISSDALSYSGEVKRDEYPYPLTGVMHNLRPGDDPLFPTGGKRLYFFDMKPDSPSYGLPVIIFALDPSGNEVEYYLTEKMRNPAGLTDANFNPSRLK